jgi:hypothetical protein
MEFVGVVAIIGEKLLKVLAANYAVDTLKFIDKKPSN